ncbi:MAG: hypothetical protein OXR67_05895 [Chloroflexota bacterium]|nr:hypothetical protein [Chloroflexota bacterium]
MFNLLIAPIREMGRGCLFGAGCLIGVVVALLIVGLFFGLVENWVVYLVDRLRAAL